MKSHKEVCDFINSCGCEWIEARVAPSNVNSLKEKIWVSINNTHSIQFEIDFFKNDINAIEFSNYDLNSFLRKVKDCTAKFNRPITLEEYRTFENKIHIFLKK